MQNIVQINILFNSIYTNKRDKDTEGTRTATQAVMMFPLPPHGCIVGRVGDDANSFYHGSGAGRMRAGKTQQNVTQYRSIEEYL